MGAPSSSSGVGFAVPDFGSSSERTVKSQVISIKKKKKNHLFMVHMWTCW